MSANRTRTNRRGSEAVEFALVMPVLVALAFATVDYGLYFWERLQVTNALQTAVRTGAMVRPSDAEIEAKHGCAACISTTERVAQDRMIAIGAQAEAATLTPDLTPVAGVCVLDLRAVVAYEPLIGMFPLPESYDVRVRLAAQGAKGC